MSFSMKVLTRSLMTSAIRHGRPIKHVTVIGGGLMGTGIALVSAQHGYDVTIVDKNADLLERAMFRIQHSLSRVIKKQFKDDKQAGSKFKKEALSRIHRSQHPEDSVDKADLVIEAIIENLEAKRQMFKSIDEVAPQHTIFASNTSSLLISEIGSSTERMDRFGGLHFFNPAPVMKLLEVCRTPRMSEETFQTLMEFGSSIGKTTVVTKDTPGFIVNRLVVPYLAEAVRMYERGDASLRDIDTAMKLGAGYPMGPVELMDYMGLDTNKFVLAGWKKKFPDNTLFDPVDSLNKLVKQGKLGVKSDEGFYKYR